MEQKIERPGKIPHIYGQFIYDKRGKNIQQGKDSHINKWYWENWTATCKRMKLDPYLTHIHKTQLKLD